MAEIMLSDEADHHIAWRMRLATAIVYREFDDETLLVMLHAGLHQAHSEGLNDAAHICETVAVQRPQAQHVASVLAKAIRELDELNRKGESK